MYNLDNTLLMCAYIRGYIINNNNNIYISNNLILHKNLFDLTKNEIEELISIGKKEDLKLYYFKEKNELPRITKTIGFLKNIYPTSLLDIGSGRGLFILPLLKTFPNINVTSIDILPKRVEMFKYLHDGGIENINSYLDNITTTKIENNSYEVVTLLEVLEHIEDVKKAIENAVRISKKYIVITVPSKPDDNPEHIHLLTKEVLSNIFNELNITNLKFGGVNGHLFLIVTKE